MEHNLLSKKPIVISLIIFLVAGILGYLFYSSTQPSKLDGFALCLKQRGAKFYGAFWCPHCQNQKALFGTSAKHLPYIECSTTDGAGQLPICNEKNISSYPTWYFADESSKSGELSLEALAEKTSCHLPN